MRRLKRSAGWCRRVGWLASLMALAAVASAQADVETDKAAIAARLQDFTAAFNARDAAGACHIFAPDLVSTMRGRPDNGREAVCKRIAAALADRSKTIRYAPDDEEIIVSGDLAVVRLLWIDRDAERGDARLEGTRPRRLPPAAGRKMVDRPLSGVLERTGLSGDCYGVLQSGGLGWRLSAPAPLVGAGRGGGSREAEIAWTFAREILSG